MAYKPIRTQEQYDFVANRLEQLKDAIPYTPEARELKALTEMIVGYELRRVASDDSQPDPASQT